MASLAEFEVVMLCAAGIGGNQGTVGSSGKEYLLISSPFK
jgi:hypothetical protein